MFLKYPSCFYNPNVGSPLFEGAETLYLGAITCHLTLHLFPISLQCCQIVPNFPGILSQIDNMSEVAGSLYLRAITCQLGLHDQPYFRTVLPNCLEASRNSEQNRQHRISLFKLYDEGCPQIFTIACS